MQSDSPAPTLRLSDDGAVRILTLDRGHRRNALDTALASQLLGALQEANRDESVGAVLIAANGAAFCAGADLGEFKGERANPVAEAHRSDVFLDLLLAFEALDIPIVCAVQGPAVGAGAAMAIAADLTVMGASARLAYPEIVHGMVPTLMIAHLQRRTGRKKCFELLAVGEAISAEEALALGLTNRVVPDEDLSATALGLAQMLAGRHRAALRETKRLLVAHAALPVDEALRRAREASRARQAAALRAAAAQEGAR